MSSPIEKTLKGWCVKDKKVFNSASVVSTTEIKESTDIVLPLTDPLIDFVELYKDLTPVLLIQHERNLAQLEEFPNFLQCVDAFFTNSELAQEAKSLEHVKSPHQTKQEKIKSNQIQRIEALRLDQEKALEHALLIEKNVDFVQSCISMLQQALETGVNWVDLWNHIKLERRRCHPIASAIHELRLEKNEVVVLLSHTKTDDNQETLEDESMIPVVIDLTLSAYANVEKLHGSRKFMRDKVQRTVTAAEKALQQIEKQKDTKQMKGLTQQNVQVAKLARIRKRFWFERFHWFISSENYLILAGRDSTQNDLLYKRYIERNDIYVHADAHGAPSCIIKNPESNAAVSAVSLLEAGRMSVCRSILWDKKIMSGSWWVYPVQVSKSAPTGEFVSAGGFIIRGKKNLLPPGKLEMGLGILFQLGEDSVRGHLNERVKRLVLAEDSTGQLPTEEYCKQTEETLRKEDAEHEQKVAIRQQRFLEKQTRKNETLPQEKKKSTFTAESVDETQKKKKKTPIEKIRGKRTKWKRVLAKYKDQDDEEKELRMLLLGTKNMSIAEAKVYESVQHNAENSEVKFDETLRNNHMVRDQHCESETSNKDIWSLQEDTEMNPPTDRQIIDENSSDSKSSISNSEKVMHLQDTCKADLDFLTALPKQEDTILSAIPMCAPWSSLQNFKYKVKLTPGSMKKGKVAHLCQQFLIQQATEPLEKELLRLIDINDLLNCLMSNVSVVSPGVQKLKIMEKSAQKKMKKTSLLNLDLEKDID